MPDTFTPQQYNLRIQKWVAFVSVILLAVKFLAYHLTSSVAILTDALESIVNVIASLIGLYSLYIAARPSDVNHPYGHGKAEFISAGLEGVLIGIAGVVILYKAIYQLMYPTTVQKIDLGIILIAVTAGINYIMGYVCVTIGKKNKSLALEASGKHLQTDTYSTIAVITGLMILFFSNLYWIDSAIAIVLSVFILYTSYNIIRKSVAGIMDEADSKLLTEMVELLNSNRRQSWIDLHNLRVIKYGRTLHVDAHLTMPWYLNLNDAHEELDELSSLIKNQYGQTLEMFIHTDPCIEGLQCPICEKQNCAVRKVKFENKIPWTLSNVVKNKKHNPQTSSLNL